MNMFKNLPGSYKGQTTLLVVLMVMAVSLGIGVAVSQRQSSNLRKTTYTSQTDQSFSCANSGVEDALLYLKNTSSPSLPYSDSQQICNDGTVSTDCTSNEGIECAFEYDIEAEDGGEVTLPKLPRDNVQQFITNGVGGITIQWQRAAETGSGDKPSIEVTYAYEDGGIYKMSKGVYSCDGVPSGGDASGFENTNSTDGECERNIDFQDDLGADIDTSGESIVRLRPYFADAYVTVSGLEDGQNQGYRITSHGTVGRVVRTIEVLRMNPQLPPLFDYVLYSEEGSINK